MVAWLALVCQRWPSALAGTRFIFLCDNEPWVDTVENGRSKLPQLAFLLEMLHDLQCRHSFGLLPIYITSKANIEADALSRGAFDEFYAAVFASRGLRAHQLTQVSLPALDSLICTMASLLR